jgi:hypothetical protein
MSDPSKDEQAAETRKRRWFVILAIITLIGFALFTGAITVFAVRIPELKKPRFGMIEGVRGDRSA